LAATARLPRRPTLVVAIATVLVLTAVVAVRATEQAARATAGVSPYVVPLVVDTNPSPTIVETTITADEATVDIGGGVTATGMAFNGTIPGPEFRLNVGDTVIVHFRNKLEAEATGIHWHGIELNNASDGTPLTQNQTPPGGEFLYKFKVPRPGVFWYHPHHHSSTNQVFKGLYGSMIVTDPNEAALAGSGVIPSAGRTRTVVLSDMTVCKEPGSNDASTYPSNLPHVSGSPLPAQPSPFPTTLCDTPIDDQGNPIGAPLPAGSAPNIQKAGTSGRVNEGQTVLTNGMNVGGRAGTPASPGALAGGASTLSVEPGQGQRLQLINAATIRYMRLRLTTSAGVLIPLIRIGGEGGLLDSAVQEGGVVSGFDWKYGAGEILLGPGDRADVVAAIPASATGVATMWTQDFQRTGAGYANLPTVPVMHLNVTGASGTYAIAPGAGLRSATGNPVEALGAATSTLLNPATFVPAKPGLASQNMQLTQSGGGLSFDNFNGTHDNPGDYTTTPVPGSARYAKVGDLLELTVQNTTGGHHPYHLHGFSIQPKSFTVPGGPSYVFPYNEFLDEIDIPAGQTLTFRVRIDDRPLMDGVTPGGALGRWVMHCHIFFHAVFGMISELQIVAADGNAQPNVNTNAATVVVTKGQTATVTGTFSDRDGDAVTLSVGPPAAGAVTATGPGTWSWSLATSAASQSQIVHIVATDAGGRKNEIAFQLVVMPARPPIADFGGDGASDRSVYRPSTGQWFVRSGSPEVTQYGVAGDVPVPADYNGDGAVEKAVYRPSTGQWFIRNAPPVAEVIPYGAPCSSNCAVAGDIPVPADYDGDGAVEIAVYRPSTGQWFVRGGSPELVQYGAGCGACSSATDVPVPADYNGDGAADIAVYRLATGQWFVRGGPEGVPYGVGGDIPVAADYNGDGAADIAVYRPSTGQWFRRGVAPEVIQYGAGGACCGDIPVPGDFDGAGGADTAVYRRSTGQWFVRGGAPEVVPYGATGDIPLALAYPVRVQTGLGQ